MHDSHIHIGQFYDIYTSPKEAVTFLDRVSIEKFAVSSTTICEADYTKVLSEITEITHLAPNRALPVLWIVPQMLIDGGLEIFLDSKIAWRCLKIHPQLHPTSWQYNDKNLQKVLEIAKQMHLPLLIHTGESEGCYPSLFETAIAENQDVKFILAHGRPINETISLLKKYPNAYCDTAFMPAPNIVKLCKEQLAHRVLFGSDYPIMKKFSPEKSIETLYLNNVKEIQTLLSSTEFKKITCQNFESLL